MDTPIDELDMCSYISEVCQKFGVIRKRSSKVVVYQNFVANLHFTLVHDPSKTVQNFIITV